MLKKILCAALMFGVVNAYGQVKNYPCKKLIETNKLEKAEPKITAQLTKTPNECLSNFAAYKLKSTKNYHNFNPQEAYKNLEKAQKDFISCDDKKHAKLLKTGVTSEEFTKEFTNVSQLGLNIADSINTVDSYNNFLSFYLQANQEQKTIATNKRNALAYQQAEEENTVESFQNFINTYPDAKEYNQAVLHRNALAYNKASALGTVDAYKTFIQKYPNANQVELAWQNIYRLEYNNALKINTESTYRDYAAKYPQSPYAETAIEKANLLQFKNEVEIGNWKSYRDYINYHPSNKNLIDLAKKEIFTISKNSHNLEALEYIAQNDNIRKDSALIILHDIYANASSTYSLHKFYNNFDVDDCPSFNSIKAKDQKIDDLNSLASNDEYIKTVAPYYPAYLRLQKMVSEYIDKKQWSKALEIVSNYKDYFGDNYCYKNLLNTLESPYDKSVKVTNMGTNINFTPGRQYSAAISADSKTLLFCGRNRKDSKGGEDIFISENKGGVWTKSKPLPDVNTSYGNEAPEALSADGTKLILFKNGKICTSNKTKTGWTTPENVSSSINICSWQADAMISSDGKAMLFAAAESTPHELVEGYDVYTKSNIYVSLLDENGEWGEPIDLGPTINTPFCDRAPFLHPDMKTLYFSSSGHGSIGDLDIFMSTRLSDDSWTQWSTPVNLGKEINTTQSDCWYKISTDGKKAYFSKEANNSNDQIYWINLPEKLRPNPVATISGIMKDKKGEPISTSITWEDLEENKKVGQSQTDPVDGSFFIVLPMGKNYGYYVNDEDYFPIANNIDLRNKNENVVLEHNIEVATIQQMIEDSIPMPMNNIFFAVGDSTVMPTSIAELTRVAKLITKIGKKVQISGHTDNTGDFSKNQTLSEARARAVYNVLIEQGCNANLMTTQGYGQTKPIATNKTAQGRQQNRRVEIVFIK